MQGILRFAQNDRIRDYENRHHWPAASRQDISVPHSDQGPSFRPGLLNPREAHIGVAKVPDDRLDKLAALYNPKKLTHASVEYVDVGAIGQDALKETAYIGHLRQVDALIHVLRAFENDCHSARWPRSIRCATSRTSSSI